MPAQGDAGDMTGLIATSRLLLDDLARQGARSGISGYLPDYVPALAKANPQEFAAAVQAVDGRSWDRSPPGRRVVLMSVMKPLLLFYALALLGLEAVSGLVGCQPSAKAYNDLDQLLEDAGHPRNPMLNSGALALAGALPGTTARDRVRRFQAWLYRETGCLMPVNETVLASVQSLPNGRNRALVQTLVDSGRVAEPEIALEIYNRLCCLGITMPELAALGCWFANPPSQWAELVQQTLGAIAVGGLYQDSETWMAHVGWPTKSGVSGVVWSIQPGQGSIACYSPLLNPQGHSILGLDFVEGAIRWF